MRKIGVCPRFGVGVHVWYLSVMTVLVQALASLGLLQREFRRRLGSPVPATTD